MKEDDIKNESIYSLPEDVYIDFEHEAQSICIDVPINEEEKSKPTQKEKEVSREQKIKDLKDKTNEYLSLAVKKRSSQSFLKSLVSQDKNRFCFDGFDLDLTYITPRIIAMGLPSTSYEALYRNNMADVLNFFNARQPEHYKVYN